jgi:hypothetical protein
MSKKHSSIVVDADYKVVDEVRYGNFIARRIDVDNDLAWGEGTIQPLAEYQSQEDHRTLIKAVLQSLEPVSKEQKPYSLCTDGRIPVALLDGSPVPVREQIVGTDTTSGLYVAETLGDSFYSTPNLSMDARISEVRDFLKAHGIMPCGHLACGAAAGFTVITENVPRFADNPLFESRTKALLPANTYDVELRVRMHQDNPKRLQKDIYQDLSAELLLAAAERVSGKQAIAQLKDDGRGVNGHTEEAIIRVKVQGVAINEAKVAAMTGGREVFGVNDVRMDELAQLFARDETERKIARMALEDFANAGHGTLAKNLPTWVVTAIQE